MTLCARDIAAALRERVPGLDVLRLHKFLYYCQGHHLATFGEPLFCETICAWNNGPVVRSLWHEERNGDAPHQPQPVAGEAPLNTIGYVLSRYGGLSGNDLINLTHGETPWKLANASRKPGESVRIERDWMRDYFTTDGAPGNGGEDFTLDSAEVAEWLRDADARRQGPGRPDDIERLRARLAARG